MNHRAPLDLMIGLTGCPQNTSSHSGLSALASGAICGANGTSDFASQSVAGPSVARPTLAVKWHAQNRAAGGDLRRVLSAAAVAFLIFGLATAAHAGVSYPLPKIPEGMKRVDGTDYVLIHDLSEEEAFEVQSRMTAMAREYESRTRGFAGRIQGKMPFLLFRQEEAYKAAGGMDGTAGVFNPNNNTLMAVAGKKLTAGTWHVIQHEGFHQYAHFVIGGELPVWVNEGLAEYFGEGVYCGDGYVAGGIPAFRLKRIKQAIKESQFTAVDAMMKMSHEEWNRQMAGANYDQAWAMVQFLAHADGGRYQQPFVKFMNDLARRQPAAKAWQTAFGNSEGFQQRFEAWWQEQPERATTDVYATAAVRMLANYAARSASQKQATATLDELVGRIKAGQVTTAPPDALPVGLAVDCVTLVDGLKKAGVTLALEYPKKGPNQWPTAVTATLEDGKVIRGTVSVRGVRAGKADVTTVGAPRKAVTKTGGR